MSNDACEWQDRIEIAIFPAVNGKITTFNVEARTYALSDQVAKALAEQVLDWLARDKLAFIRCAPESTTQVDYLTDKKSSQGYVRFGFVDTPGEWKHAQKLENGVLVNLKF